LLLGVAGGLIHGTVFGAVLAALAYVLLDVAPGAPPAASRAVALSIWPLAVLGMLAVHLVAARERLAGRLGEFGEFAQNPADGSLNTAIAVGVPGSGTGVGH
jgi:hypothetical protein